MIIPRSISGDEKDEKIDKTKTAKIAERLAKESLVNFHIFKKFKYFLQKREKLLSMKRCSGYLKRPEILETVYSVEGGDGRRVHFKQISLQDPDDQADMLVSGLETEGSKREIKDSLDMREDVIIRGESETTEYDLSTDDESLR